MKAPEDKPDFRFTPDVLRTIRLRVRQGRVGPEIAEELGCLYGSLRKVCAKHGISLRAPPPVPDEPLVRRPVVLTQAGAPRHDFCFPLSTKSQTVLMRSALLRGVSLEVLAAAILERVASDDLTQAVLDD